MHRDNTREDGMTKEQAVEMILAELERAEKIHPVWPTDIIHAGAVVAEEAGELLQACNNYESNPHKPNVHFINMEEEAIQTGAMAIRFLINL
jgi:NTP pyrophosphatase (non-canonical NTP hydrolase)